MRIPFLSLGLALTLLTQAQTNYKSFQWQNRPVLHQVDKKYESEAAVILDDDRIHEFIFEKNELYLYRTMHRTVHLNNDQAIEQFNRIYLPFGEGMELVDVRARTILPGGKVVELDKNNIRDLKEEDGEYKIFALEGLTKGCEVEYYFTVKKDPSFFAREVIASGVPIQRSRFELISPAHLVFETKSYNNYPNTRDSTGGEKRYLIAEGTNLDGLEEEKYAMYRANLQRIEYRLSYNKSKNPAERLFTWNELAKKVHAIHTEFSSKDLKALKDLLGTIGPKGQEAEKIVQIENYIKKNFNSHENVSNADSEDLGKTIKGKVMSERALCKIYIGLFQAAGINYQIVLSGDRNDYTIERGFENWNTPQNFLFYFPATKKFLAPTEVEYRYPWIPPTWAATNGLFCVTTTIGDFTSAIGEVRSIPMEATEHSYINMDLKVKMLKDETLDLEVRQLYGGYAASNYRLPFVFAPADQQESILKQMVKFGANSQSIAKHSFENKDLDNADPYKPFVIQASVKSKYLTERAGEKLLIKIGELIGEQTEMYDVRKRMLGVELSYPHLLVRNIEFEIPEGYVIKNPEALSLNEVFEENGKETMGFSSSYSIKGNILTITIRETYMRVSYPKAQYDTFKKIINLSADFNKVVLILDKK